MGTLLVFVSGEGYYYEMSTYKREQIAKVVMVIVMLQLWQAFYPTLTGAFKALSEIGKSGIVLYNITIC